MKHLLRLHQLHVRMQWRWKWQKLDELSVLAGWWGVIMAYKRCSRPTSSYSNDHISNFEKWSIMKRVKCVLNYSMGRTEMTNFPFFSRIFKEKIPLITWHQSVYCWLCCENYNISTRILKRTKKRRRRMKRDVRVRVQNRIPSVKKATIRWWLSWCGRNTFATWLTKILHFIWVCVCVQFSQLDQRQTFHYYKSCDSLESRCDSF